MKERIDNIISNSEKVITILANINLNDMPEIVSDKLKLVNVKVTERLKYLNDNYNTIISDKYGYDEYQRILAEEKYINELILVLSEYK